MPGVGCCFSYRFTHKVIAKQPSLGSAMPRRADCSIRIINNVDGYEKRLIKIQEEVATNGATVIHERAQ